MPERRTNLTASPPPKHPLVQPPRLSLWGLIVLIGWLAFLRWSPEQSLAILLTLLPAAGVVAGDLG